MAELPEIDQVPRLPRRAADAHKGTFGRVLIVGGSRGMAGAVSLAGMAALRSGAGLVKLAVGGSCQMTVASFEPSYMTLALPEDENGSISGEALGTILELAESHDAVACGPGLSRSAALNTLVLKLFQKVACPLVLDADALNALAEQEEWGKPPGPRVLTPHPGEFGRLVQKSIQEVQQNREAEAARLAQQRQVIVVLKGHHTCISDGQQLAINPTGNPGMASGGSGDVLTGILAGLLGQKLSPWEATRLGVYLHGLAGDVAAEKFGQESMIASDLVASIPAAMQQLRRAWDALEASR